MEIHQFYELAAYVSFHLDAEGWGVPGDVPFSFSFSSFVEVIIGRVEGQLLSEFISVQHILI